MGKTLYYATFIGRLKLALGIRYSLGAFVEAESPEQAEIELYKTYDSISDLKLTALPAAEPEENPKEL